MAKQVQVQAKPKGHNMKQLLDSVKKEMVELTSLPFNTISGVTLDEETHTPIVTIELVERKAIPDSMDLLGIYQAIMDEEGGIATFKRVSMRKRGDVISSTEY